MLSAAGHVNAASPYAPVSITCPTDALVRKANGLSSLEAAYVKKRKAIATTALISYLAKTGAKFPALTTSEYPELALATSGGGFTSFLTSAGVHKGLSDDDIASRCL